jgi:hypothetical protein
LGGTGKSRYSEDQIKCKVRSKLIKDVLPIHWEMDECLVYWVNFFTSFIAIYHPHMKYCETKDEVKEEKEFGSMQKEQKKKLKYIWEKKKKKRKRLVENLMEKYDQMFWGWTM